MIYTVTTSPSLDLVMQLSSPLTQGQVNRVAHEELRPGGKGINISIMLHNLGVTSTAFGFVAGFSGDELMRLTAALGVKTGFLRVRRGRTRINVRLKSEGQSGQTSINGLGPEVSSDDIAYLVRKIAKLTSEDYLVLAGMVPPSLPQDIYSTFFECLSSQPQLNRPKVIVDAPAEQFKYVLKYGPFLLKPNLKEFSEATGKQFDPATPGFFGEAVDAGRKLCKRFGISNLLVTLSEHGMIFIPAADQETPFIIPTEALEVFDVSGAGDTSLAALGAALAAGARMDQAIRIANKASGIVVGKFGTASVTPEELKAELPGSTSSRILTPEQAQKLVHTLREQGKCIGFTNGCFDLLHPGHLQSFALARQACDVLFVGLNSDASVRRLKGPTRPINTEQSRAALLCGLKHVDYVVIFDDDTALPLIERLRPDVIAKEGYPLDRWPEGRAVIAYGGRALELPRLEGFSTTSIIGKLS